MPGDRSIIVVLFLGVMIPAAAASSSSDAFLRSSCSSARFPDLCVSTIAANPSLAASLSTHKQVIEATINQTLANVRTSYSNVDRLKKRPGLTPLLQTALDDCLQNLDITLDELELAYKDLQIYPSKKPLSEQAEDLNIVLSAAVTNEDTCLDGFSHDDNGKKLRKELERGLVIVKHMCSNVLAMTCNLTNSDIEKAAVKGRKLWEEEAVDGDGFPRWLSVGDRRLLQATSVTPDVTVAADGSGNYRTVAAAVAAAPERSSRRYVIRIKAGVYRENVEVPKKKTNLMFLGDGRGKTVITGSRNVRDGSTTFRSATVAVVGGGFLARGVTFENTAGPSKHQAVALRVGSDLSAFYDCEMRAYQDTLYVHSLRQFFRSCLVSGTVDFIFGNAAAVFQNTDIRPRRPNPGQRNMVTAQGRDDPNQNTGIVIHDCSIAAADDLRPVQASFPSYLGRPWKRYSRTVVMTTAITDVIRPEGWFPWDGNFALDTLFYAEYQNTGAGAATGGRVTWKGFKVITSAAEAQRYTLGNFVVGGSWVGATGFPFKLGL